MTFNIGNKKIWVTLALFILYATLIKTQFIFTNVFFTTIVVGLVSAFILTRVDDNDFVIDLRSKLSKEEDEEAEAVKTELALRKQIMYGVATGDVDLNKARQVLAFMDENTLMALPSGEREQV